MVWMPPDGAFLMVAGNVREKLEKLEKRGCDFLGSRYAVMGGGMTWVSERNLVAAISNAGGFGVIACGSMDPARLRIEIQGPMALTVRPFGVNLLPMHPPPHARIEV